MILHATFPPIQTRQSSRRGRSDFIKRPALKRLNNFAKTKLWAPRILADEIEPANPAAPRLTKVNIG
jgi:hypothetical protein